MSWQDRGVSDAENPPLRSKGLSPGKQRVNHIAALSRFAPPTRC
jgi:hypothetical protein